MAKIKSARRQSNQKKRPGNAVSNKIKKKAPKVGVTDARNKIIAKTINKTGDARGRLAVIAQGTDARKRLERLRNLKDGKLDVKKTKKGGITIVTTTQGKLQLTTKKKEAKAKAIAGDPHATVTQIGKNVTKSVNLAGKISLTTKPKTTALIASSNASNKPKKKDSRKPLASRTAPANNTQNGSRLKKITKTIKSKAAQLDDELLNTHVDPVVIQRTVRQSVRERSRSPLFTSHGSRFRERSRSRSPIRREYDRPIYHYDDPRREAREEEALRQRIRENDLRRQQEASYLTSGEVMANITPFAGTKVVISNLNSSVSQEDLSELFGDVGPLRRIKMSSQGSMGAAEIVFLKQDDAERAVEAYHNRVLDNYPMKCQIISTGGGSPKAMGSTIRLPPSSRRQDDAGHDSYGAPDISSIHKALFSERKTDAVGTAVPYASSGGTGQQSNRNKKQQKQNPDPYASSGGTGQQFNRNKKQQNQKSNQKFTVVMPKQGQNQGNQRRRDQPPPPRRRR